ncbi:hypothetical protein LR948_18180 [Roseivivax sp. GX 12232]|uniref:hypothetical protein n=1 Tax=Roseivivax sp. GX 12232 TaxID=2900547 RepID=UPI001E48F907|nr:hypothetical protein [Roseivivax sp. GX 12232]MCE0507296.1 hypothetical protein [Roseivivax sp. GX 12232]
MPKRDGGELIIAGCSFVTEALFSHPSKLEVFEAARARGYLVVVMHVGVDGADLSVGRVRCRTEEGGYDVHEEKILARYERGQPLIHEAVLLADRCMVFDNSHLNTASRQMLVFASGRLILAVPILPEWILKGYAADLLY